MTPRHAFPAGRGLAAIALLWSVHALSCAAPVPVAADRTAGRAAAPVDDAQDGRPVLRLVGRSGVMTIHTGPQGLEYSLVRPNGVVAFSRISEDRLRTEHPQVHEGLRLRFATDDPIWAGLDDPLRDTTFGE